MASSGSGGSGRMWIRRQVFDHSFTAPLLQSDIVSALVKNDVIQKVRDAVLAQSGTQAGTAARRAPTLEYAELRAALAVNTMGNDLLSVLPESVRMLCMHAPRTFLECNPGAGATDIERDAQGSSRLPNRTCTMDALKLLENGPENMRLPLPELFLFTQLGSAVKSLAVSGKENANSQWVERGEGAALAMDVSPAPLSAGAATSAAPGAAIPGSPRRRHSGDVNASTGKRSNQNTHILQSPGVKSSALHDLTKETSIVIEQMHLLVNIIGWCYGLISSLDPSGPFAIHKLHLRHLEFLLTAGNNADGSMRDLLVGGLEKVFADDKDTANSNEVAEALKLALMNGMNYINQNTNTTAATSSGGKSSAGAVSSGSTGELEDGPKDLLEMAGLTRKTLVRAGTETLPIRGKDLRISNCNQCYIYLVAPLSRVSIVGCVECTVFIAGACSLSVIGCGRVTVIGSAMRVRITNAMDSVFHIATNNRLIMTGDNRGVYLAPYNAQYMLFKEHTKDVGVRLDRIDWDAYFTPALLDRSGIHVSSPEYARGLRLNPEKFLPFVVPWMGDAPSKPSSDPVAPLYSLDGVPLPDDYKSALEAKTKNVEDLRAAMRAAQAERDAAAAAAAGSDGAQSHRGGDIQAIVQEYFREWLVSSGNMRQIHDLVRLEQEFSSEKGAGTQ
ncbi:TBCC domain-containing protein 1 [Porphyridium purpureum]|uniref:TBCC domain-containing protein 1 n=1 Tax=Porphyridium purpureum TaxID=35688 RepID=A0A5J4YKS7_PORPP|nr:TBCC domain-containing protein 1 [Porphyridium purpureum]|eukprot:POR1345..scf291_13